MPAAAAEARCFQLVLIKPSHYADDGYVVQWLRSSIPSNSLATVYALAADTANRGVLGSDVAIDITAFDETNTRVRFKDLIAQFRRHDNFGLVALVGVQSNQFPRSLDIARPLREAGIPVVIGGFHVSGCLAMLPELQEDLKTALDLGCSLFAGEGEGRLDQVLLDAAAGKLEPIYNFIDDLPNLEAAPTPFLPRQTIARTINHHGSFDAGRGCPFQCSFCTIINVQGRKSRRRSADDVEQLLRRHSAEGVRHFLISDDNFARNKDWEPIFDRIIALREEGMDLRFLIQVDTGCHKIPNFIPKAQRAGVTRVFIGLENINPANLLAAKKRQNKITEYRKMLLAWKNAGIITYAGYIIGFPHDTPESIREDIAIIQKELPLDILEFFYLTPLPGSEDHKVLWQLEHVVADHPKMTRAQCESTYRAAWDLYYTPQHMSTVLRRAAASGMGMSRLMSVLFFFSTAVAIEGVHPLQGGVFRLKYRRDRRPGFPIESAWKFYPDYLWEIISKHARMAWHWCGLELIRRRAVREQKIGSYTDLALTPLTEEEAGELELFTHNEGAKHEVARTRKIAALTGFGGIMAETGAR